MRRRGFLIAGGAALAAGGGWLGGGFARRGSPSEYAAAMAALRAGIDQPALRELVRYATLAANGHNTQPWRFRLSASRIVMTPDLGRRTPVVDPDDHHLCVSLGCAAENLTLAAAAHGRAGTPRFDAAGAGSVVFDLAAAPAQRSPLYAAIPRRQSTRAEYDGRAVSAADLARLEEAARVPGVQAVLITDRARLGKVADLVIAGNSAQMADPAFMAELRGWMRFNPRAALGSGDGIYSAASGNPSLPTWLGVRMFDLAFRPGAENDRYARHLASSAGVLVLLGERADPEHWVRVGRACQRFALQATALGLKHAFINQPVEVTALRPELAALAGAPGRRPDILMRFGYGPTLPLSPRRPVEAVIDA